jgi:ribosomal protein S18 acetylase RimI-like enzyme
MDDIRALTVDEVDPAAALLGRAFQDNPLYRAVLAHMSDEARAGAVRRVKRGFVAAAVRYQDGRALWVDGRMAAVCLSCAPTQYPHKPLAFALHTRGCLTTGWRGVRNFLRTNAYLTGRHPREAHHYLFVLGVEPELQGRGLGSRLLRALSDRADAGGHPCYLETDKPASVELYRRAGYEVLTEEDVAGVKGLHVWTMRRPPRPAKQGNSAEAGVSPSNAP